MKKKREDPPLPETPEARPGPQNAMQRFYEKFRKVPLKYIDLFIALCFTALAVVVVLGMLKGRGIL